MNILPLDLVRIEKFHELTEYTPSAVRGKIATGVWREGEHFLKAPDGHILISLEEYSDGPRDRDPSAWNQHLNQLLLEGQEVPAHATDGTYEGQSQVRRTPEINDSPGNHPGNIRSVQVF